MSRRYPRFFWKHEKSVKAAIADKQIYPSPVKQGIQRIRDCPHLKETTTLLVGQPMTKDVAGDFVDSHTSPRHWESHISHRRTFSFSLYVPPDLTNK